MKRNKIFLACIGALFLAACAKDTEISTDPSVTESNVATDDSTELDENSSDTALEGAASEDDAAGQENSAEGEQEYEYPSEDAGPVLEESRLGYSMTFDPTVFTLDDTGEDLDIYTYHTSELLDGPAYIAVQSYPDMDAQTLADGLALQSGQDGVTAQDTYFGADGLDTKCVYYEETVDGVTQAHAFYAVPKGEGSLLVEITGYVNMPQQIEAKFEEMLGTFALT